jgi:hypothetical protein
MVDKSLKIIKLIKNAVSLILDNFGIVGFLIFGRIPALVYQCSRLTFLFILIVF